MKLFVKKILLIALLFLPSLTFAAEIFPEAKLKEYATAYPEQALEDVTIHCYLQALLGEKNLKRLVSNLQLMSIPDADKVKDTQGAYEFSGGVEGLFTIEEGLLLIHPDGRIWVGILDSGKIDYYTNDKASYLHPPAAVLEWASRDKSLKWNYASSEKDQFEKKIAANCSSAQLAQQMKINQQQQSGELCDTNSQFSSTVVAAITPTHSAKVYFKDSKSYLIKDDLVLLAAAKPNQDQWICALYHSDAKKQLAGWLPKENIKMVNDLLLKNRAQSANMPVQKWKGTWEKKLNENDYADLIITSPDNQTLHVNGSATHGGNLGSIDQKPYKIKGASALSAMLGSPKEDECDKIQLYLFNRALYVVDNTTSCSGLNVTFSGVYFLTKPKLSRD